MKRALGLVVMGLCAAAAQPALALDPVCVDLIADGGSAATAAFAGQVCVTNDTQNLNVTFTTDGWCMKQTHLQVAAAAEGIPQKNGNPIPGKFLYQETYASCQTVATYEVPLPSFTPVFIAAHAVVNDVSALLLATKNDHPVAGQLSMPAKIYSISLTGDVAELSALPAPVNGNITDNFNGNAFDQSTNRFYFSDFQRNPSTLLASPSPLYFNDLLGSQVQAGTLLGGASGGTIFNGNYYYVAERTDDFMMVPLNADGTLGVEVKLADVLNGNGVLAFGDIAVRSSDQVVFGSATKLPTGGNIFFSMNLDGTGYVEIPMAPGSPIGAGGVQIAFGPDGILYGVNARSPFQLYSVNTANGATQFIKNLGVSFSDLAPGPALQDETGWGAGTALSGSNWAMYFTYTPQ